MSLIRVGAQQLMSTPKKYQFKHKKLKNPQK